MKIMVALDGSRLAERSLAYLPLLNPLRIDSVTLISVVEDFDEGAEVRGAEDFFERQSVMFSAYLADMAKKIRPALDCDVTTELACGVPDQEIQKLARAAGIDLLVLTTHGRSGLSRWAIGSVADKVVRHSDRPVLAIGPNALERTPGDAIRRIMVPLDGSTLAECGLLLAARWASALGAELHAVRIAKVPAMPPDDTLIAYSPELTEALSEAADEYLRGLDKRKSIKLDKTCVRTGSVAEELIGYCEENDIDLVAIAAHGRRGLVRAVVGSTTDRMLHGPAPLLVVPSC